MLLLRDLPYSRSSTFNRPTPIISRIQRLQKKIHLGYVFQTFYTTKLPLLLTDTKCSSASVEGIFSSAPQGMQIVPSGPIATESGAFVQPKSIRHFLDANDVNSSSIHPVDDNKSSWYNFRTLSMQ